MERISKVSPVDFSELEEDPSTRLAICDLNFRPLAWDSGHNLRITLRYPNPYVEGFMVYDCQRHQMIAKCYRHFGVQLKRGGNTWRRTLES